MPNLLTKRIDVPHLCFFSRSQAALPAQFGTRSRRKHATAMLWTPTTMRVDLLQQNAWGLFRAFWLALCVEVRRWVER
jgi:hypothetical protein